MRKRQQLVFANRYELMAYLVLEHKVAGRSMADLAEQMNLSHQRVQQIIDNGLAITDCRREWNKVRFFDRISRHIGVQRDLEPDSIEYFTRHELMFRGPYRYWGSD